MVTPQVKLRELRHKDCDAPYCGGRVLLHGLRGRHDLNGRGGDAVSFDELSGR